MAACVVCIAAADIVVRLLGAHGHHDAWLLIEMWPAFTISAVFERWWARRQRPAASELPA